MENFKKLDLVKGGNALALVGIAFRATEYCLGQWEKKRKEHHERLDKQIQSYQIEQEMERSKQLNSLKGHPSTNNN